MRLPDSAFAGANTILDVGGWFSPEPRATHVVDLMPWETRGARLTPAPQPGERFTRDTWFQADFLQPDFSLPFADASFDLVTCGHTLEDLADPGPLLGEMARVGRRGLIECPSRLIEQTMGIRDRESARPGHPHHHWIVESVGGALLLYAKADSGLEDEAGLVPLVHTDRAVARTPGADLVFHAWTGRLDHRIIRGPECRERAGGFVAALGVSEYSRQEDRLLRFARRLRRRLRGPAAVPSPWWPQIVEASRPYSKIPLP